MRGVTSATIVGLIAVVLVVSPASAAFEECEAGGDITVGAVACRKIDAADTLGGPIAFSYYVPAACTETARCSTLYLLHGFSGDYRSMLGTQAAPSAWVKALNYGPARDVEAVIDPWLDSPDTWMTKPPIDVVLVAPHGRTLANPSAFGPVPNVDLFYADWNPRFADGGDAEAYATPPPRFETFFTQELIPFVETTLPVGSGREWRAIDGVSLGGYGAYKIGLQHPDLFASIGSVSGSHNILVAPGPDPIHVSPPVEVAPPAPLPYVPLLSVGSRIPIASFPTQAQGFAAAFYVFGDPSFDQAWFRGNQPRDLAMNGRAFAGITQSVSLNGLYNDAIPRRPGDLGPSYPVAQVFEALVLAMNLETEIAFTDQGVDFTHRMNPGLHSGVYWDPFLRGRLEDHVNLLAPDGDSPPAPTAFDFRSISRDFNVWGWRFQVNRQTVEFLNIRDASCAGVTLQGTGIVTITPPASCGKAPVTVDLGYAYPTDEQAGASAVPVYGNTERVNF